MQVAVSSTSDTLGILLSTTALFGRGTVFIFRDALATTPGEKPPTKLTKPLKIAHEADETAHETDHSLFVPLGHPTTAGPQGELGGGAAGRSPPCVQDLQGGGVQVCAHSLLDDSLPVRTARLKA